MGNIQVLDDHGDAEDIESLRNTVYNFFNENARHDGDGIGNNADLDDDNDGYNDTEDFFPNNATEHEDNDLDGIGNNADLDDDNDGYEDTEDINPLNDLALNFNLGWIELIDKQSNRADTPVTFYLYQNNESIHLFDNDNKPWRVPWQERFYLNSTLKE